MTETLTNPLPPPGPRPDRFAPQGPGDESTAGSGRGGVPLLTAFLSLLVVGTDLFVVSPLLPAIADDYGVSAGAAGASVTAFSLAYMLAAPAVGTLADRVGRRAVLVVALGGFAAANALTGLAPTFALLIAARVAAGCFASGTTPSLLSLVGQSAPGDRRGTWMSTA